MKVSRSRPSIGGAFLFVAILGLLLAGIIAATCQKSGKTGRSGAGVYIATPADLMPEANPGPQTIDYGGTKIVAEAKTKSTDGEFVIELYYNGVSMEKEVYKSGSKEFDLVNAAGEDYSPPIPLLTFPMNSGASWNWSGQMITGPAGRKATASITTREDKIDVGYLADALVVEVAISMESGASAPASRKLTFWFVKNKGVVRREFGDSTSRGPALSDAGEPAASKSSTASMSIHGDSSEGK